MGGRRSPAAGLTAGAVSDDSRQDEHHADDPEQVCRMLHHEPVMVVRGGTQEMNDHVHDARSEQNRQSETAQHRK